MDQNKEIVVLIPVYNDEQGLIDSINSIEENIKLDIVIVDDGSSKGLNQEVLQSYFENGSIFLITLYNNSGIEKALNTGLEYIKQQNYTYIARLDSGDLCMPYRFEKQKNLFEKDQDLYLVGAQVSYIDMDGNFLFNSSLPETSKDLKKLTYLNCYILHSVAMFKTEVIDIFGYYSYDFPAAEDYEYFFKIIRNYKAQNHPDILLKYLINPNGISNLRRKRQVKSKLKVIWKHRYFGLYPVLGLLRNSFLYFFPRSIVVAVRKLLP